MAEPARPKEVIVYKDSNDRCPFEKWLYGLRDAKGRRSILMRVRKLEQGIYGDHKLLGDGVSELRIFLGPGYRVYIGEHGNKIVVLLGGDKDGQKNDIQQAKILWKEYKKHERLSDR